MFAGPSLFMIGLFLFYPAIRTIYLSFKDRYGTSFVGLENYVWSFNDTEMLVTLRNQIIWLVFVVFFTLFFGLIYEYRPPPLTQIGILNGIRVSAGENCYNNRVIDGSLKDYADSSCNRAIGWLQQRDLSNFQIGQNLESASWLDNILVNLPLNTVLLLVIMIWAYTGFAAVVFSAGIKSIPTDIMEAGQIDGASELKIFVSIVVPYIKSTIIVVGTYMVITVLKAFDIVYVTTRGDLETNLLAVKMLDEFSKYRNIGRSSTVAVLIFICVIPIIIGNTYREKENSSI